MYSNIMNIPVIKSEFVPELRKVISSLWDEGPEYYSKWAQENSISRYIYDYMKAIDHITDDGYISICDTDQQWEGTYSFAKFLEKYVRDDSAQSLSFYNEDGTTERFLYIDGKLFTDYQLINNQDATYSLMKYIGIYEPFIVCNDEQITMFQKGLKFAWSII